MRLLDEKVPVHLEIGIETAFHDDDPEEHNVFWINFFDLQGAIQDIQVQRGAGASYYGSTGIGGAINAAYATNHERESGSLKVGKQADLIVVDRDLFAVPVQQLSESRVLLTLLVGREVWRDSTFHAAVRPRP